MPACLLILTLDPAVTQYGQLLFGIFNPSIVTGKLSIVSNHIDNIFQIVKYLVNRRSAYTSCSCLPLYCLYDIPSMWPLPGDCTYLPTCLHKDEEEKEKEDCPGQTANTGKIILNYLKLLLRKRNMIIPDVYLFMPVNLSFWSEYVNSLNSNQTFICKAWYKA